MKPDQFIVKLKEQFMDGDEIELDINTEFRKIASWDSLTAMSILVMIKEDFELDISLIEFKSFNTIGDIFSFIEKNNFNGNLS